MKLTPLFPADVKPVRKGWYETENPWCSDGGVMSAYRWRWDGCRWVDAHNIPSAKQNRRWRGLAQDPRKS